MNFVETYAIIHSLLLSDNNDDYEIAVQLIDKTNALELIIPLYPFIRSSEVSYLAFYAVSNRYVELGFVGIGDRSSSIGEIYKFQVRNKKNKENGDTIKY